MVQSVSNVNFNQNTRFTKKGNSYQKTNAVTLAGVGIGAAYGVIKNAKLIFKSKDMIKQAEDNLPLIDDTVKYMLRSTSSRDSALEQFLESDTYKNIIRAIPKIGVASIIGTGILGSAIAGLFVGGIANFITNKKRAKNADKNSQTTQVQPQTTQVQPQATSQQRTTTLNIKPPF